MDKQIRITFLVILDILLINLAYYLALYLRFDGNIDPRFLQIYINNCVIITVAKIVTFYFFKLYKSVWKFAGIDELLQVAMASIVANTLVISYLFLVQQHLPRGVYVITAILDMMFIGGFRLSYRMLPRMKKVDFGVKENDKRVMVIGAGDAGAIIIKELRNHEQLRSKPVVIIDDDAKKEGQIIYHVPVMGQRADIVTLAEKMKIDEIIIAIPSASKQTIREIVKECEKTKCRLKILPGVYELIDGKADFNAIRNVQIEDLLGRDEIKLDMEAVCEDLKDKKVMITGGGGSIGSELARQIAKFRPRELILLDIYENNVYDLQNELKRIYRVAENDHEYANTDKVDFYLRIVIASIQDEPRMDEIIRKIRPDIIFHAAAHKHVPLMEQNPKAAAINNVFGTLNVASIASKYNVKKFVMVSTDKAVNPTNIMGATKRVCEMIVQSLDQVSKTEFALVRFGNVLGSNGSVVPLFKKQIQEQGFLTLTHPDIIRYFMTIPEAARLVIQAGAMAKGGEIFVLDMGEPVKIMDLACDLIRLSGFEPEVDIPIKITGLRPGEKLYEELLMDEEGIQSTGHDKIFIGKPIDIDFKILMKSLEHLKTILPSSSNQEIKEYLQLLVPTYKNEVPENKALHSVK